MKAISFFNVFLFIPRILKFLILMISIISLQKGWSTDFLKQEGEDIHISTSSLSTLSQVFAGMDEEEVSMFKEKVSGHSGPQWGLHEKEIDYLFENSKDFVCILEFGGYFKRLNKTWTYILGWSTKELMDKPYITYIHPEDIEKTIAYEKNFQPSGLINRFRCKDGSYRWLDWIGFPLMHPSNSNNLQEFPLSIARDVTLRQLFEKRLEKRVEKVHQENLCKKQRLLEAMIDIQVSPIFNPSMREKKASVIIFIKPLFRSLLD